MNNCTICGNHMGQFTRGGRLPIATTVDPGGAVPPDAPHQPQTVRLYTAQVTRDLAPEPAAAHSGAASVSTQR